MTMVDSWREGISVVISTYNGEKYIIEQLESIVNQTKSVDEIIIKDDCSDDKTVELVRDFIDSKKLKHIKLIVNTQNLGWKRNFVEALYLSHGSLIFFCDQDDIWLPNKVEAMTRIMKTNSNIWLLTSDYKILRMDNDRGYVKEKEMVNKLIEKYIPQRNVISVHYPGCTYCISSKLIPYYKKYWKENVPHDAFAWSIANIYGRLYFLHQKLIIYRRHNDTATGKKIEDYSQRLEHLSSFKVLIKLYLYLISKMTIPVIDIGEIRNIAMWHKNRYMVIHDRSITAAIENAFLLKYYNSPAQYLMDIKYAFVGNR